MPKQKQPKRPLESQALAQLKELKAQFKLWCDNNWPVSLDSDLDWAVDGVYKALKELKRATKNAGIDPK